MELLLSIFTVFALFLFTTILLELKFRLVQKLYQKILGVFEWHYAIFALRGIWLIVTILLSFLPNSMPVFIPIPSWNRFFVEYTLAVLGATLILAFLADLKYWKNYVLNLEYSGDLRHKILIIQTSCTFCITALFGFLLGIQSKTAEILEEYTAETGLTDSWVLIMFVAWLAASFASIKVVNDHLSNVLGQRRSLSNENKNNNTKYKIRQYVCRCHKSKKTICKNRKRNR